ncbi:hypothetical protein PF005_g27012 [Phytophthora fragariae]|nr:hypothetical protein PF005_g27012 [Phytophthora fragariae]
MGLATTTAATTGTTTSNVTTASASSTGSQATVTSLTPPVGTAGAPVEHLGVQQVGVVGIPDIKPRASSKPPKHDDTFEVYQLKLRLYREQRDSWNVVTDDETRHAVDLVLQRLFDVRNRVAMEAIIRGVVGADAQKVCNCTSAKEMYDTLIAEKTQRDYSYAVHLKRELYAHSYTPGQKMADYIQEMNSLRQRLQHMGPSFAIDDTSMYQALLMGVCAVHRELVTQFDFSYRQGNPPTKNKCEMRFFLVTRWKIWRQIQP